jgi:peptide/nickel transport system substrate-binding protein
MPHISSRSPAVRRGAFLAALAAAGILAAGAATRPHYGGVLRVETREAIETADPPQTGPGMARLSGPFSITHWEAGRRAIFAADDNAPGGRPFLDSVEILMARPVREQSIDLRTGKADVVELGPNDLRDTSGSRKVWASMPVRVVALVFGARIEDARVREALALSVNRDAIHNVLLQRQGEISGALLPQWVSGYAFLFPAAPDLARAKALLAGLPGPVRAISLGVDRPATSLAGVADRIALNAHDAELTVSVISQPALADVRLVEMRISSGDPARALAELAVQLGLPEPSRTDSPEGLYAAERAMLEGFRVIPLFHLPDVYGASPRVKGGSGITPLGEWRFDRLWIEGGKP